MRARSGGLVPGVTVIGTGGVLVAWLPEASRAVAVTSRAVSPVRPSRAVEVENGASESTTVSSIKPLASTRRNSTSVTARLSLASAVSTTASTLASTICSKTASISSVSWISAKTPPVSSEIVR